MRQNRRNHKRSDGIRLGIEKRFAEEGADLILLGEICSVQNTGAAAAFFGIGCGEIGRRGYLR